MLNLLQEIINFIFSLGGSIVDVIGAVLTFALNALVIFHTDMPRIEGMTIGILLAWFMTRREKHPILKVLSTPLKLSLDILDLLWDEAIDAAKDTWAVSKDWSTKPIVWLKEKVKSAYSFTVAKLTVFKKEKTEEKI